MGMATKHRTNWKVHRSGTCMGRCFLKNLCLPLASTTINWLVVSTHLKNISQNGNLPQIGVNIKNVWNHQLVKILVFPQFGWFKTLRVLRNGGYINPPIVLMVGKESQGHRLSHLVRPFGKSTENNTFLGSIVLWQYKWVSVYTYIEKYIT